MATTIQTITTQADLSSYTYSREDYSSWSVAATTAASHSAAVTTHAAAASLNYLVWQDYLVFAISLSLPLFIGLFFLLNSIIGKKSTTEDFLVGDRSVNFFAVALSLLGSLLNGIFVLGTPAEIRYYGIKYAYVVFGLLVAVIVVSIVFVPTYQRLKFTSAYEYIEKRYNYATRVVASLTFCASVIIYLSVVLFVPAFAFAQVTGVSEYIIIAVAGVICTIYTAMGGIRAVVYVDALQMIILLIGLLTITIMGTANVGGGQKVWDIAVSTGRINFNDGHSSFSFDPRTRHTFWTQFIGQGWTYGGLFLCNQMMIQRYMSVSSPAKAQGALILTFVAFIPLAALGVMIGLILNAQYYQCDPLVQKVNPITTADQLVPRYIMMLLGNYHGVPGLLIASIFSAALSSIASVINALSAVCLEDLISPLALSINKRPLDDKSRRWIAIAIVVFFGLVTIGLSYAASLFTNSLVSATGTIWGVIDGPLAGAFIAAFFIPFCNSAGAISGIIGALIIALWISVGGMIYQPTYPTLPVGVCIGNHTSSLPPPTPNSTSHWFPLLELYNVTYGWYGVIGIFSSVIINVIVSLIWSLIMETCVEKGWILKRIRQIPPMLMYSCADKLYCYCPETCKECCRCGVDYEKTELINGELQIRQDEQFEHSNESWNLTNDDDFGINGNGNVRLDKFERN